MLNAVLPVPPVMLKANVSPVSSSVATTVSTAVLLALFSSIVNVWAAMTGASLILVRFTVMVAEPVNVPVPSSATCTVKPNVVVVS